MKITAVILLTLLTGCGTAVGLGLGATKMVTKAVL
jgi:hypothetical protein